MAEAPLESAVVRLRAVESSGYRSGRSLTVYRKADEREPDFGAADGEWPGSEASEAWPGSGADGEWLGPEEREPGPEADEWVLDRCPPNNAASRAAHVIELEVRWDVGGEDAEPVHVFELESDERYTVYWLYIEPLNCKSRKLSEHTTRARAELYAKLQYHRHTGDYPHVGGEELGESRPAVKPPDEWGDLCDEIPELRANECGTEWLLVAHRDHAEAFSLNQGDRW